MGYDNQINRYNFIEKTVKPLVGSHYLWGAKGETPNEGGTIDFAPIVLNISAPATAVFCAAHSKQFGNICAGAPVLMMKDTKRDLAKQGYKNPLNPRDPLLLDFIAKNAGASQINWDTRPTPRTAIITNHDKSREQFFCWGDGCDGTQHFDCIGFICYCLNKIDSSFPISLDISHFFYSPESKSRRLFNKAGLTAEMIGGKTISPGETLMAADIIIYGSILTSAEQEENFFKKRAEKEKESGKDDDARIDQADADAIASGQATDTFLPKYGIGMGLHHIAFASGDGYGTVEALDSRNGVCTRPDYTQNPGNVVRIIRLDDYYFRNASPK